MAGTNQSVPKYKRHTKSVKDERDYIDKDKFYEALVDYNRQLREAEEKFLPEPRPSDYIGECIMMIVDRIIKSHRFNGYTDLWKDEMRSEAIVSAVKSIKKFDIEKSDNPFAYFTTATYYNFYNTINKEKKSHKAITDYDNEDQVNYTEIGADGFKYTVSDIILERRDDDYDWGVSDEADDNFDWNKKAAKSDMEYDRSRDNSNDDEGVTVYIDDLSEDDYNELSYEIGTDYDNDSDDDLAEDYEEKDNKLSIDSLLG